MKTTENKLIGILLNDYLKRKPKIIKEFSSQFQL